MDRRDLEGLTRDELLSHARAAGIDGAEWLSREELVAMLSRGASTGRPAGIIDRARALIERARRSLLRPMSTPEPPAPPVPPPPREPPAGPGPGRMDASSAEPDTGSAAAGAGPERFETVTMAEVYAAQGLPDDARRIARLILAREPDHAGAKTLLDRLGDPAVGDDGSEEPPAAYDEDVACLHLVRADLLYAWWEVTPGGRGRAQAVLAGPGRLVLRLATQAASDSTVRDEALADATVGDAFLRDVSPGARHRIAVGLLADSGRFVPIAHSSAVWTPRVGPSPDTRVEWLEVPLGGRSPTVTPPAPVRRTAAELPLQARAHRLARQSQP